MAYPQTLALATLAAPQMSVGGASALEEISRERKMASRLLFYIWYLPSCNRAADSTEQVLTHRPSRDWDIVAVLRHVVICARRDIMSPRSYL